MITKKTILRNTELLNNPLDDLAKANKPLKERKQKQLKEQLFNKTLLDNMPGIYYLYSYPALQLIGWNKEYEIIFGGKTDEVKGRTVLNWHLLENEGYVREKIDCFSAQEQIVIEAPLLTKGGSLIPFLLTLVKFMSEGQQYLVGIGTDVSERKKVEEALRDSQTILTKAQQIAHMGSWEYDYKIDRMKCSDETFRIFGYQPGEIVPTLEVFYNMVHQDDYHILMDRIEDVRKFYVPLNIDLRILYPNGEEGFIHEQAEMTFDSEGVPSKWVGTVHDITQRKRTEEELQKLLEQQQQLSKHIEEVRENERLGIARELHDDLGQALTAVKIDLEIIKKNSSDTVIKEQLENVKVMIGNTIRTVQRITSQLRPEIIDDLGLEAAIDWYAKEYAKRYGIDVFLDIDSEVHLPNEASLPLFRIMQESLTNIARHARATHIEILLFQQGGYIQFMVSDNGVGISEDEINSKKSFGIMSMKERAASLGGSFDISRGDEFGSKVSISFPINVD